jgi:ABC-2 type transport system permease protein
MSIHDLGYRSWQGPLVPQVGRFWVIAQTGIRLTWRNAWVRRLLFFSWLPALYIAVLLCLYEQILAQIEARVPVHGRLPWLEGVPLSENRHQIWACLLWIFYRYPQMVAVLLVVGQIAPPLVARDVRTKAFLLYFSRPLARFEYVLGKMVVVWAYLVLISAVPAILLYAVGVLISPDWRVLYATWDLPLRSMAASAVLIFPMTAVALAFSSLTSETRYATFAWFAFLGVGWAVNSILKLNIPSANHARWDLVSMSHTVGTIQYWIFGLKHELADLVSVASRVALAPRGSGASILPAPEEVHVWPAAIQVLTITAVALGILFRRVSSPMKI